MQLFFVLPNFDSRSRVSNKTDHLRNQTGTMSGGGPNYDPAERITMGTFNFPFRRGFPGLLLAFVCSLIALVSAEFMATGIKTELQGLSIFQRTDSTVFDAAFELVSYCLMFGAMGTALWLFADFRNNSFFRSINFSFGDLRARWRKLLGISVLGYIGVIVLTYALYALVSLPTPQSPAADYGRQLSGLAFVFFIISAVILAPIVEEMIFRGLIQNMLRAVFRSDATKWLIVRDVLALIVTAAIFAGMHGTLTGFPVLFISGGMMGFVYMRTGLLWASIGLHFINNAIATLILLAAL